MTVANAMNGLSEIVLDHFHNPRNPGPMDSPCGDGVSGSPPGQPFVRMQIRVAGGLVEEARFLTYGCVPAISASSFLTEWVRGRALDDAARLTGKQLIEALGGLPRDKHFCADLAVDALRAALDDARRRSGEEAS